jgi:hypothetical protein
VKVDAALAGVRILFLDTAPVIYLIERNPRYVALARAVFRFVVRGDIIAVTSPVTLAETLVAPLRAGMPELQRQCRRRIVDGQNTSCVERYGVMSSHCVARLSTGIEYSHGWSDAVACICSSRLQVIPMSSRDERTGYSGRQNDGVRRHAQSAAMAPPRAPHRCRG